MPTVTNPVAVSLTVPSLFSDGTAIPVGFITQLQYGFGTTSGTYTVIVDDHAVATKKAFVPALTLEPGTWYGAARLITADGPGEWGNESSFQVIARIPKVITDMQITAVRTLTTALAAPALSSSVAGSTATLTWVPPAPTGQSIIAGYRVYRSSSLNGTYTQVGGSLPANQLSLTDSLPGTQFYKVEAFDQFVTGGRSAGVQCNPVSGTRRKWTPGHYGASGGTADASDNTSTTNGAATPGSRFYPEIDDMLSDPWIVGYAQFCHWGTFEWQGLGVYDWRMLDAIFNRCKSKGKQYVLRLVPMTFSGGTLKPGSNVIPPYIQNDPQYGPSPIAGSYGWWGPVGPNWSATTTYQPGAKVTYTNYNTYNCVATALGSSQAPGNTTFWQVAGGAYAAAVYRPAVAARYAALGVAIANHIPAGSTQRLADDPYFEAITDQEDSAVVGPANARNSFGGASSNDSSYSDTAFTSARQSYYLAWQNAMPTVNIAPQTKFMFAQQPTYDFLKWQMQNGFPSGSSDTAGQTYYNPKPPGGGAISNSWGQTAYFGLDPGGQDWRPTMPALYDVEGPNIGQKVAVSQGATPLDLCNALNQTVKATHAFWCYVPQDPTVTWRGGSGKLPVTTVLRDNPLIRTAYPIGYPQ